MITVFGGSGFVGSAFRKYSTEITVNIPRDVRVPASKDILYLISTTDNYNVNEDIFKDVKTNLIVLLEHLRYLKPGDTFNFVSSWFVYGESLGVPAAEEWTGQPKGFYSITKLCAEQLLASYCETNQINYRIFRLANVYGSGDKVCSAKKNAMQWLVGKVCRGEPVSLYDGGNSVRDYIHVSDAARAIDLCMKVAPLNSITNIGSGKRTKLKSIINYAKIITGSQSSVSPVRPPDFHSQVQAKDFAMNVDKLKSYGFRRRVKLKEGIREICGL